MGHYAAYAKVSFGLGLSIIILFSFINVTDGQINKESDESVTTSTQNPTEKPKFSCSQYTNTTCSDCVSSSPKCYFCHKTSVCADYPYKTLTPMKECGSLGEMAWGVCWVNFEILIIVVSVIGGVLLISICVCCCCCCRKRKRGLWAQDQAKYERQRTELKARGEDRKKERQSRTDEIRRKYGLMKDDTPYHRFDA